MGNSLLDVLISRSTSGSFSTTTFRKPTFTGLYTNFHSFTPFRYKSGLVNTLVDRACNKINSSFNNFLVNLKSLTHFLERNHFPRTLLDKLVNRFTKQKDHGQQQAHQSQATHDTETGLQIHYFKLPYIGRMSKHAESSINKFCSQLMQRS